MNISATPGRFGPGVRAAIAIVAVALMHIAIAVALLWRTPLVTPGKSRDGDALVLTALTAVEPETKSVASSPLSISFRSPPISIPVPPDVEFDAGETETPAALSLPPSFEPPRLASGEGETLPEFTRRAAIETGRIARVILRVEVLTDGSTGSVEVETTSGTRTADEAAVGYARTLRWRPAYMGGKAQVMKIRLPVVFTGGT